MARTRANDHAGHSLLNKMRGALPVDRIEVLDGDDGVVARLLPETGAELGLILVAARELDMSIAVPGQPPPDRMPQAVLDLGRLSRILDLDQSSRLVTVQAGVTLGTLERWVGVHGWTLGWYAPALRRRTVASVLQTPCAPFVSPRYGTPVGALRGFRAVLPDSKQAWHRIGPRRATGPDLLGLLRGGFSFGVVTRAVFSIHPAPETELLWTLRAKKLDPLLRFAAEEVRSGVPPRRLLALRDQAPEVPLSERGWLLHLSWHENHEHARSLDARARFRGVSVSPLVLTSTETTGALAPAGRCPCHRLVGGVPGELVDALERSPQPWVVGMGERGDSWVWTADGRAGRSRDPVSRWLEKRVVRAREAAEPLRKALSRAVDPGSLIAGEGG